MVTCHVVLRLQVPFVDEQRLLSAARSVTAERLTEAERARNTLGDMLIFERKEGPCPASCVDRARQGLLLRPTY